MAEFLQASQDLQETQEETQETMNKIVRLYEQIRDLRYKPTKNGLLSETYYIMRSYDSNRRKFFIYCAVMRAVLDVHGIVFGGFARDWLEIKNKELTQKSYDINYDFESTAITHGISDIDVIMTKSQFLEFRNNMHRKGYLDYLRDSKNYPIDLVDGFNHRQYIFVSLDYTRGGFILDLLEVKKLIV